jgi:hypothetical protein
MSNDYTPRKEDEAFALPPVPAGLSVPIGCERVAREYGERCAEAARAPLLARIAELEQYEDMVILRCGELETFDEYRVAMQRDDSEILRAEAKARADAERYRWLRDNQSRLRTRDVLARHMRREWDAAIDAEIAAQRGEGE